VILKDAGVYSPMYDLFGPVFWQMMLENAAMNRASLNAERGVDTFFLSLAHESGKEILEVESLDFQIGLLTSDAAQKEAWKMLPVVAENFDAYVASYAFLYDAYATGDMAALEFAVFGNSANLAKTGDEKLDALIQTFNAEQEGDSEYSLTARNGHMADMAAEYLASGKKVFFVVGAGHMVGPGGIPALLEEMGFTVEKT
jgi:uncharacterized protein YbaP (TraB family)